MRFYRALRRYIDDQGYDLGVLVAFSGTVSDDGDEVTEAKLNRFPDTETAARFDTDAYRLLVVAEKFQPGSTNPSCMRCTSTRRSPASLRCRPCPG